MHLYVMTRGIKHDSERMMTELASQYVPYKFNGEDGVIQVSVRPIQLWEIVMPKEQLPVIMRSIWEQEPLPIHTNFMQKLRLDVMRKALMAKPVPKFETYKDSPYKPFYKSNVACYPIGIKEDKEHEFGEGI